METSAALTPGILASGSRRAHTRVGINNANASQAVISATTTGNAPNSTKTVVGMLVVLWLVYAELFRIRAICLRWAVVHIRGPRSSAS